MMDLRSAVPTAMLRGRNLATNAARFLAVAGIALSMSASSAFAMPEPPVSNDVNPNNDSQGYVADVAAELVPVVIADDLVPHQDASADAAADVTAPAENPES
jgi:hypothetical protein